MRSMDRIQYLHTQYFQISILLSPHSALARAQRIHAGIYRTYHVRSRVPYTRKNLQTNTNKVLFFFFFLFADSLFLPGEVSNNSLPYKHTLTMYYIHVLRNSGIHPNYPPNRTWILVPAFFGGGFMSTHPRQNLQHCALLHAEPQFALGSWV